MALAKNQLRVLCLLAESLARGQEEMAGIEVADAIGGLGRSSAYAALAALQRDGMVKARWALPDEEEDTRGGCSKISPVGQTALRATEQMQPGHGVVWEAGGA